MGSIEAERGPAAESESKAKLPPGKRGVFLSWGCHAGYAFEHL